LLYGSSIFGLLVWIAVLILLATLPGITTLTFLCAAAMAALFGSLLLSHLIAEIDLGSEGIAARTVFRKLRCKWSGVRRVEVRPLLPGITIYLISTARGPVVFTSLWRNSRRLLEALRDRALLA
jgi:uncharacterized membrane protein